MDQIDIKMVEVAAKKENATKEERLAEAYRTIMEVIKYMFYVLI